MLTATTNFQNALAAFHAGHSQGSLTTLEIALAEWRMVLP